MEETVIFQPSKIYQGGIRIPFSELFRPEFAPYEDFDLTTKRTYSNNRDLIALHNNLIVKFDRNHEVMANYMICKYQIDMLRYTDPDEFIHSMVSMVLKPWFVQDVCEYVEKEYNEKSEDIDKNLHNNNQTFNSSLIFTNEHAIILYRIAMLFRFIVPLATQFIKKYSDMISNKDPSELYKSEYGGNYQSLEQASLYGKKTFTKTQFLVDVVKEVISVATYDCPEMNIYGKLNHYTLSLAKGTGYSDQEMWNKLAMLSTSKYNLADVIVFKILIDIMPKAIFEKSIVKFIVTTIEQHIHWALHQDFKISYNMVSGVAEDSDFSDADRFEINSVKMNEFRKIIASSEFMDDTINIIFNRHGYVLDMDEYNFFLQGDSLHSIQESMIRNFFASSFGSWGNLDALSQPQYVKLLCYLENFMTTGEKFKILPKIFTGKLISQSEKRILSKPVERKIHESIRYQRIMDKYKYTGNTLAMSKAIERNILDILNSTIELNEYKGQHNGELLELDITGVCDEYLKFVELL